MVAVAVLLSPNGVGELPLRHHMPDIRLPKPLAPEYGLFSRESVVPATFDYRVFRRMWTNFDNIGLIFYEETTQW